MILDLLKDFPHEFNLEIMQEIARITNKQVENVEIIDIINNKDILYRKVNNKVGGCVDLSIAIWEKAYEQNKDQTAN